MHTHVAACTLSHSHVFSRLLTETRSVVFSVKEKPTEYTIVGSVTFILHEVNIYRAALQTLCKVNY